MATALGVSGLEITYIGELYIEQPTIRPGSSAWLGHAGHCYANCWWEIH